MAIDSTQTTVSDSWQDLGVGPGVVTLEWGPYVKVRIASSGPSANEAGHRLTRRGNSSYTHTDSRHVYVKKRSTDAEETVVTYTGY